MTNAERLTPGRTALILLAGGRSARFGAADKLAAPLWGMPLGLHAAAALSDVPFAARIAVCGETVLDYAAHGFLVVVNLDPAAGASSSVRLGVAAARDHDAVLIALADMPCITADHVLRLFAHSDGASSVVALSDGVRPSPPALIGAAHFDALLALTGDAGARDLIRGGRHVIAPTETLIDIDTPADLAALTSHIR